MKTLTITILTLLSLLNGVFAYDMCTDTRTVNSNCTMITPSLTCSEYNYTVYSTNGGVSQQGSLSLVNQSVYSFNLTVGAGDYFIVLCDATTREVRVTDEDESKMIAVALIMLPMIFGGFLLYGSKSLDEEHTSLKWFLFLLSFAMLFVSLHFGLISVVKFYDFPELQNLIGSTVYWYAWTFALLVMYLFVYMIWKGMAMRTQRKEERLRY